MNGLRIEMRGCVCGKGVSRRTQMHNANQLVVSQPGEFGLWQAKRGGLDQRAGSDSGSGYNTFHGQAGARVWTSILGIARE
ncbi:hypothetical protein HYE67_007158 [Fusarium culmorum]|uniref:Uncharacterized protein n=1 Tax=Fusarium culmorum TaxID=5516 RepID=A0A7S8DAE8_FUSCU|nr:hypothetical protein HYE67_007158 [Fusarium culmorum]